MVKRRKDLRLSQNSKIPRKLQVLDHHQIKGKTKKFFELFNNVHRKSTMTFLGKVVLVYLDIESFYY